MRTRPPATSAVALLAAGLLLLAAPPASSAAQEQDAEPGEAFVYQLPPGVASRASSPTAWAAAALSAHRVEGGTLVYWAVRSMDDEARWTPQHVRVFPWASATERASVASTRMRVQGVDKVFFPLDDGQECLCTGGYGPERYQDPGETGILYAVFPEIPEDVTSIDVDLSGNNDWARGLAVQEGALPEPQVDARVVTFGEGYPAAPEPGEWATTVADAADPHMMTMLRRVQSSDGTRSVAQSDEYTQLDISSEVFFGNLEDQLSPEAGETLQDLADDIEAAGATEVAVTGHTDSRGGTGENQTLSENRAQSVAQALGALLPGVEITAEGRGMQEPIATNSTEEGMAQNRRVEISYVGEQR